MSQDTIRPDHDYILQLKKFPCNFNLISVEKITISRLRYIRHNLISELELENDCVEEVIRKKSLLTLVEFLLGDKNRALELNSEVIKLTDWSNIASLGNRCFIMVSIGDEPEAKKCLKVLKKLRKLQKNFDNLLTEAEAEQAYCYSRLGGADNLRHAIGLFSLAVRKRPENYLWKFGLGLACRRATHTNIYCSSPDRLNVEEFKHMAAENLFDVGENAEGNLRAMAYAQLVKLRQDYPSKTFPQYDSLFRQLNIQQLCNKALEHGMNMPSVLTQCGRSLKEVDLNRATELLERSVAIKRNTISYHHLGMSYMKQAEMSADTKTTKSSDEPGELDDKSWRLFDPILVRSSRKDASVPDITDCSHNSHVNTMRVQQQIDLGDDRAQQEQEVHMSPTIEVDCAEDLHYLQQQFSEKGRNFVRSMSCDYILDQVTEVSSESASIQKYSKGDRNFSNRRHQNNDISEKIRECKWKSQSGSSGRQYNRSLSDGWSPRDEVKAFLASSVMSVSLNRGDALVQKAISCYKAAIELSNGENLPAKLDLGLILKQTGQVKEALTQFNRITNSQLSLTAHRVTVISAYEQAGLCYLELSKMEDGAKSHEKEAQKKLTRAISLAADLATKISELKDCAQDVWVALRTLLNELNKGPQSRNRQKEKIRLLELVRDYGQIVEVVQKLRELSEDELKDPDIVRSALNSYLKLEQPENALAFQNMIGIDRGIRDSEWWENEHMRDLRAKVLLQAISGRLRETNENTTYLFQQLFELTYGTCVGLSAGQGNEEEAPVRNNVGDVLVVYDDDQHTEEDLSFAMKTGRCLTLISACLFGLEARENLQVCIEMLSRYG